MKEEIEQRWQEEEKNVHCGGLWKMWLFVGRCRQLTRDGFIYLLRSLARCYAHDSVEI